MTEYVLDIIAENNEFYVVLPLELLNELDWSIGDDVIWEICESTSQVLLKKQQSTSN